MKTEAIKVQQKIITVAGIELLAIKMPEGNYKISLSQLALALHLQPTQLRRLEGLQNLPVVDLKPLQSKGRKGLQSTKAVLLGNAELSDALLELTLKGNQLAGALMKALVKEAFDRRCDQAFGVQKSEKTYEDQTRDFFRQLAKETFHPLMTSKMNGSFPNNRWGTEINNVKKAVGLPLIHCGEYNREQMMLWSDTITRYNCLREMDKSHKQTLVELHRQVVERVA